MQLFFGTVTACRYATSTCFARLVLAETREQARSVIHKDSIGLYPPDEGWVQHTVSLAEVPTRTLVEWAAACLPPSTDDLAVLLNHYAAEGVHVKLENWIDSSGKRVWEATLTSNDVIKFGISASPLTALQYAAERFERCTSGVQHA